jgi:hypothetical protein
VDGDWAAGTVHRRHPQAPSTGAIHRRHPQAGAERRRAAQQTVIDSTIAMNQRSVVQYRILAEGRDPDGRPCRIRSSLTAVPIA